MLCRLLFATVTIFSLLQNASGKSPDRYFLSKCSCEKELDRPDCDFSDLSKKRLLGLTERLITNQIICISVGEKEEKRYMPTFTPIMLPLDKVVTPLSTGSIELPVEITSTLPHLSNPTAPPTRKPNCVADGLNVNLPNVNLLYPTPLYASTIITNATHVQYNNDLKEHLLNLAKEGKGCTYNLHGGYRTQDGLLSTKMRAISWLKAEITTRVKDLLKLSNSSLPFTLDGWGQVLSKGQGQDVHVHPQSMYAGVYYISAPPEISNSHSSEGCLYFTDPRPGAVLTQFERGRAMWGDSVEICPASTGGLLVLFPSFLPHAVRPFTYEGQRIAISFNVNLKVA
eukprot:gene29496-35601_t